MARRARMEAWKNNPAGEKMLLSCCTMVAWERVGRVRVISAADFEEWQRLKQESRQQKLRRTERRHAFSIDSYWAGAGLEWSSSSWWISTIFYSINVPSGLAPAHVPLMPAALSLPISHFAAVPALHACWSKPINSLCFFIDKAISLRLCIVTPLWVI